MVTEQSPEEIQRELLRRLGPNLGPVYSDLRDQVLQLHLHWQQFQALYGHSQESVDVLNRAAPTFFALIQSILADYVLLGIARLNDPAEQGKPRADGTLPYLNQSLRHMAAIIEAEDPPLFARISPLLRTAQRQCEFAQVWRNKRIAHRERTYALNPGARSLPRADVERIEAALASIRAVMNEIEPDVMFDDPLAPGGAEHLVRLLERGERARASLRQLELERGSHVCSLWDGQRG